MRDLLIMFAIAMLGTFALSAIAGRETKDDKRRNQAFSMLGESALKKKLNEAVETRVKRSRRESTELMCLQAGFNISYAEYLIISIAVSIVFFILAALVIKNLALSIVFSALGYFLPGQIVSALKNARVKKFEKQVGPFMEMQIKRYESTRNFGKALELTMQEFEGEEPMASELRKLIIDVKIGTPIPTAMEKFALRTGNKYLMRFADFYGIASHIGTEEVRQRLMPQALNQYKEDRQIKRDLKKEISGPANESYILVAAIPVIAAYQTVANPDYVSFMTGTLVGQVGTAVIFGVVVGALWFINSKISKPID